MDIFTVRGSEYEMGRSLGRRFQKAMPEAAEAGLRALQNPEIKADFDAVKAKLLKEYPGDMAHLRGRANGAGVDEDGYLAFAFGEILEGRDHCTDIMIKNKDGVLMGHNEDGAYTADNSAFVKYEYPDYYFYDYTSTDALAGGSFGFNSHGLALTMNYMQAPDRRYREIPVWFILRGLIECPDVAAVLRRLENISCASGFNVNVADASGRVVTIEGRFNQIDVIEVNDWYIHANHYIHGAFPVHFSNPGSSTLFRQAKATELLKRQDIAEMTISDVADILDYHGESYYNSIRNVGAEDGSLTVCRFCYDGRKATVKCYLDDTTLEMTL